MYNQTYDDYMRNVLGYSSLDGYRIGCMNNMGMNTGNINNIGMNSMGTMNTMVMNTQDMSCEDLEHLYPEVYKVIYPIVYSSCDRINPSILITDEMVTHITNEIYDSVESDPRINIDLNVEVSESDTSKTSSETRQKRPRNRFLQDLIRILFLRELFRRRRFPGMGRPPFPMRPF